MITRRHGKRTGRKRVFPGVRVTPDPSELRRDVLAVVPLMEETSTTRGRIAPRGGLAQRILLEGVRRTDAELTEVTYNAG